LPQVSKNQIQLRELDLEEKRLLLGAQRFAEGLRVVKHALSTAGWVGSVWLVMSGLNELASKSPESLGAVSKIVNAMHLGMWVAVVAAAIFGVTSYLERKGKKRAIREKGRYQQQAEGGEEQRTSSKLTPEGDTPRET
jgi:hypothetical protein